MRTHKGMTLVEIMIAFFILSLAAGVIMQTTIREYALMQSSKAITENVFSASKQVEHTMRDYKDAIGGTPSPVPRPLQDRLMFPGAPAADQRQVSYYQVSEPIQSINGSSDPEDIYGVVTDDRPPDLPTPEITATRTTVILGSGAAEGAYGGTPATVGVEAAAIDHQELRSMIKYQWYISKTGFPVRWGNLPTDYWGIGINVPVFPDNFQVIPYATTSRLAITPDMGGKHVVCVMTPCSVNGKMGQSVLSDIEYIYGLPILNNLIAHYDASLIDGPNLDIPPTGNWKVLNWPDISNLFGYGADAVLPASSGYPVISDGINGRQVSFGSGCWLEPHGLSLAANSSFTMFAVARIYGSGTIISNGTAWVFDPAKFAFTSSFSPARFYILSLAYDSSTGLTARTVNNFSDDGADPAGTHSTAGAGTVKIGDGNLDIAELIIYDAVYDGASAEWTAITEYLNAKYNLFYLF